MINVVVLSKNQENQYSVEQGTNLLEFLLDKGYLINACCGGHKKCGKCIVNVNGVDVLSCDYIINSPIFVKVNEIERILQYNNDININDISSRKNVDVAIDIGTTTIAVAIFNSQGVYNVITCLNPQVAYGADVISRINQCSQGKTKELQSVLIKELNIIFADIVKKYYVENIFVSANCTMIHLFLGIDCSCLGVAPYTPKVLDKVVLYAREIGLDLDAKITILPSIHSFVGADIVSGIAYCGQPQNDKYNLLVDLGTNAEVALWSNSNCIVTAAAAGPCFEGANIKCGMRATIGAIDKVLISDNNELVYNIIGQEKALGICGSGIIDLVSCLIKLNIIKEDGLLTCQQDFKLFDNITFSQKDIREFQLAKSAICACIKTLLHHSKVQYEQIDNVFISGGFSKYLNIENACSVGLIPHQLREKCISIGNSSLKGLMKYKDNQDKYENIVKISKYIDLSTLQQFMDEYINNMFF